ncbi:hypothetical protein V6N11_063215 [Hibiscus sabdariffa]|uniref:Uncharacterized protein n=1 Tax=Hibiscus sabdariffa TaxID=183260 RepID=A0ABR2NWV6_9ROSI
MHQYCIATKEEVVVGEGLTSELECEALSNQHPLLSYKDIFSGGNDSSSVENNLDFDDDDIELLEDDIAFGDSNGIPSIDFSERVQQLALKSMDLALVVKVLGRRISYNAFRNHIFNIWKPSYSLKDIYPKNLAPSKDCPMDREDVQTAPVPNITLAINPLFEPTVVAQVTLPLPLIHESNLDSSSNVTNTTVANLVVNVESNPADVVDPSIHGKSKMKGKSVLTMKKVSGAPGGSKKGVVMASKSLRSHMPTPVNPMQGSRSLPQNDAFSSRFQQNLSKANILDTVKHQAVKLLESANPPIPLPMLTGSQQISGQLAMV